MDVRDVSEPGILVKKMGKLKELVILLDSRMFKQYVDLYETQTYCLRKEKTNHYLIRDVRALLAFNIVLLAWAIFN